MTHSGQSWVFIITVITDTSFYSAGGFLARQMCERSPHFSEQLVTVVTSLVAFSFLGFFESLVTSSELGTLFSVVSVGFDVSNIVSLV